METNNVCRNFQYITSYNPKEIISNKFIEKYNNSNNNIKKIVITNKVVKYIQECFISNFKNQVQQNDYSEKAINNYIKKITSPEKTQQISDFLKEFYETAHSPATTAKYLKQIKSCVNKMEDNYDYYINNMCKQNTHCGYNINNEKKVKDEKIINLIHNINETTFKMKIIEFCINNYNINTIFNSMDCFEPPRNTRIIEKITLDTKKITTKKQFNINDILKNNKNNIQVKPILEL